MAHYKCKLYPTRMNSSALNKYDRQIRTIGIEAQHRYDVLK